MSIYLEVSLGSIVKSNYLKCLLSSNTGSTFSDAENYIKNKILTSMQSDTMSSIEDSISSFISDTITSIKGELPSASGLEGMLHNITHMGFLDDILSGIDMSKVNPLIDLQSYIKYELFSGLRNNMATELEQNIASFVKTTIGDIETGLEATLGGILGVEQATASLVLGLTGSVNSLVSGMLSNLSSANISSKTASLTSGLTSSVSNITSSTTCATQAIPK